MLRLSRNVKLALSTLFQFYKTNKQEGKGHLISATSESEPHESTTLVYSFSESDFIGECVKRLCRNDTTLFQDIYESICFFLSTPLDVDGRITKVLHKYEVEAYDSHDSIKEYEGQGFFGLYYPQIIVYSAVDTPILFDEIVLPDFMTLESFVYEGGKVHKKIKVKQYSQKTQNKLVITLLHLKLSFNTLSSIMSRLESLEGCLLPSKLGGSEWRQTFYNKISGKSYFCECFREAIEGNKNRTLAVSHPHLSYALKYHSFKSGICHLCTGKNSSLFFSGYGSPFYEKYGAYITKLSIEHDLSMKDAENVIREMKGVTKIGERWVNETMLFNYVATLFPNYNVEREASPAWLGRQRLDIYIAKIKLAIEYQGQQHFMPIDFFGGEDGFQKAKERDKEKKSKCKKNGVDLVYFTYKENLSEELVVSRLKKYLV